MYKKLEPVISIGVRARAGPKVVLLILSYRAAFEHVMAAVYTLEALAWLPTQGVRLMALWDLVPSVLVPCNPESIISSCNGIRLVHWIGAQCRCLRANYTASIVFSLNSLQVARCYRQQASCSLWTASKQGWEFAHRFSERITVFLPKNERMSDSLICSFPLSDLSEMRKWANERWVNEQIPSPASKWLAARQQPSCSL